MSPWCCERQASKGNPWPKTPNMTRQDFAYIARIIAGLDLAHGTREYVVRVFATHLADTNPLFNREKFIEAAGGENG